MTAWSDTTDYVVREPVKVCAQIRNETPDTIRIFPINELGNHMKHMFFEITRPDGAVEWRKFLVVFYVEAPGLGQMGEPLPPGAHLILSLYPYMTYWCGPPSETQGKKGARFTFDKPGTYRVRVAYCVESTQRLLWRPDDGILFSSSFELHVRQPSEDESSVFDAVWSGDRFVLLCGDFATHAKSDEGKLRAAIGKYSTSPLIRYVKLTLARTLAYQSDVSSAREGIAMLTALANQYPNFRPEEIQFHRANALNLAGDRSEAIKIYDEALDRFPELMDNYLFMTQKLWVETHDSSVSGRYLRERAIGHRIRSSGDTSH